MLKRIVAVWPLWLLWLDMLYGFFLNMSKSLAMDRTPGPKSGLPLSPDIAFSWFQVLANGGMIVLVSFGFLTLLQLNRAVAQNESWALTPGRLVGLIAVLAFSLPAWWQWGWALWDLLHGHWVVDTRNMRYLVVALLMPYPAWLCIRNSIRLMRQRRQDKRLMQSQAQENLPHEEI